MSRDANKMRDVGFVVQGRVQGVGFRWWAHREAERLGIVGTVRNLSSGDVEVMARGTVEAVERFEASLRRGPPMAMVERVEAVPCALGPEVSDFTIERG